MRRAGYLSGRLLRREGHRPHNRNPADLRPGWHRCALTAGVSAAADRTPTRRQNETTNDDSRKEALQRLREEALRETFAAAGRGRAYRTARAGGAAPTQPQTGRFARRDRGQKRAADYARLHHRHRRQRQRVVLHKQRKHTGAARLFLVQRTHGDLSQQQGEDVAPRKGSTALRKAEGGARNGIHRSDKATLPHAHAHHAGYHRLATQVLPGRRRG